MKKILIIVLSEISTGELTIGYEFGSRLAKDNYDVKFLISPQFVSFLDNRKEKYVVLKSEEDAATNFLRFKQYVEEFRPDYFFLSDVYTTEYSKTWSGVCMNVLKMYGIPIIGVDEYEYLSTNFTPDYYGGIFEKLPPLLKKCDFVVRDCPLNVPRGKNDAVFNFSLYDNACEMLRRVIGMAHVPELDAIIDNTVRDIVERYCIEVAEKMLLLRNDFDEIKDFTNFVKLNI